MNQKDTSDMGMCHTVWRHRGCGLCTNPASYMCNQCRAEVNEQGMERTVMGVGREVPAGSINGSSVGSTMRSIVGSAVPADFMYV